MDETEFGFPARIDFDAAEKPRYKSKLTFGRFFIFLLAVGACGFGAYLASLDPKVWNDLENKFLGHLDNNPERRALQRMIVRRNAGDVDGALREADKLIALNPDESGYRHLRAEMLSVKKDFSEAAKELTRIVAKNPTDHTALNNRAYFLALMKKDLHQAWVDIEKAIDIGGENPVYVDTRGYLRYLLRQPKEALVDINASLKRDSRTMTREGVGEIYFHRALVQQQLGHKELAKADFERATKLGFIAGEIPLPLSEGEAKQVFDLAAGMVGKKPSI